MVCATLRSFTSIKSQKTTDSPREITVDALLDGLIVFQSLTTIIDHFLLKYYKLNQCSCGRYATYNETSKQAMKNLLAHRSGKLSLHVVNLNTFCSTPNKATNFTRKHANINKLVAIFGPGSLFHCSDAGDKNRIFSEIPLWQIGKT